MLAEHFERSGAWLFRWRSYVPLVAIAVMLLDARHWGDPASLPGTIVGGLVALAVLCALCGLALRAWAVGCAPAGTSGRNTREQVAESLNTTGAYSLVRHPLYLGTCLIGLGVSLLTFTWWLPIFYTLAFWLYYERIMFAEEAFLEERFGEQFREWAAGVPAFLPRSLSPMPATEPFSRRRALRRERDGLYSIVMLFLLFLYVGRSVHSGWRPGLGMIVAAVAATVLWLVLREATDRMSAAPS